MRRGTGGGRREEKLGYQKSPIRCQKSPIRCQKSIIRRQKIANRVSKIANQVSLITYRCGAAPAAGEKKNPSKKTVKKNRVRSHQSGVADRNQASLIRGQKSSLIRCHSSLIRRPVRGCTGGRRGGGAAGRRRAPPRGRRGGSRGRCAPVIIINMNMNIIYIIIIIIIIK